MSFTMSQHIIEAKLLFLWFDAFFFIINVPFFMHMIMVVFRARVNFFHDLLFVDGFVPLGLIPPPIDLKKNCL